MALWGTSESVTAGSGTVAVNLDTLVVTGTNSTFAAGMVGDVISIGAGNTLGEAVISSYTSGTSISIGSSEFLTPNAGAAIAGYAYTVTQKPKSTLLDSNYSSTQIYGVDSTEVGTASTLSYGGKAAGLAVAHSGWVGIKTYNDSSGNLRVKSEVLVAGGVSGDADDDTFFKDA
tara:strand:- start:30 stop:551 length:522 start_codon:yes stop_codon:yes gene_type:complete